MRDRCFRVLGLGIQDVCDALVHHELRVQRHFEVDDGAVGAEDLAQVGGRDVFGEFFYDDFGAAGVGRRGGGGAGAGEGARAGATATGRAGAAVAAVS